MLKAIYEVEAVEAIYSCETKIRNSFHKNNNLTIYGPINDNGRVNCRYEILFFLRPQRNENIQSYLFGCSLFASFKYTQTNTHTFLIVWWEARGVQSRIVRHLICALFSGRMTSTWTDNELETNWLIFCSVKFECEELSITFRLLARENEKKKNVNRPLSATRISCVRFFY